MCARQKIRRMATACRNRRRSDIRRAALPTSFGYLQDALSYDRQRKQIRDRYPML
jgi:hypothetical protein